jgi:hypothetical protein
MTKASHRKLFWHLFIFSAFYLLLSVTPAYALTITPLTFDVTVDPGQEVGNRVRVFNGDAGPVTVQVLAEDFTAVGETGGVALSDEVVPEQSAKDWLHVSPQEFVIPAGKSVDVDFILRVPLDADPGGRYTAIVFSSSPSRGVGGSAIAQKIASLLLIRVTGLVQENLAIRSLEAPDFLERGPVSFTLRLENQGTVHVRPAGYLFVQDWRGNEVERLPIPQERVIPRTLRAIDLTWDKRWLFGKYTANVAGVYGTFNEPLAARVSFWVVPWKPLAFASLFFLVMFWFVLSRRHRFARAISILFRGE